MTIFSIPAVCDVCGLLFPSGIAAGMGSSVSITNSRSSCPRCYGSGKIIDGAMQILKDGIRLFSGSDFTRDVLDSLQIAVEDLRNGRRSISDTALHLRKQSPDLADQFIKWASLGVNFVAAMAAVAAAVFAWCALPEGQNRTVDEVSIEAFESVYSASQSVKKTPYSPQTAHNIQPKSYSDAPNRKARRAEKAQNRTKQQKLKRL